MTPHDVIAQLLADPKTFKARLEEHRKVIQEHDAKLLKLKEEDKRLEAVHRNSVDQLAQAKGLVADAEAKKKTNDAKESELRAREIGVRKAESDLSERSTKKDAELRVRESDLARREAAIKPSESRLAILGRQLKDLEASLKAREVKAKEFARSLMG